MYALTIWIIKKRKNQADLNQIFEGKVWPLILTNLSHFWMKCFMSLNQLIV